MIVQMCNSCHIHRGEWSLTVPIVIDNNKGEISTIQILVCYECGFEMAENIQKHLPKFQNENNELAYNNYLEEINDNL